MSLGENLSALRASARRDGLGAALRKAFAVLRDRARPPAQTIVWLPVAEVARIEAPPGSRLRVIRSLEELTEAELHEVEHSVGRSSLEIWRQRLSAAVEAHLLFIGDRLAASRFVLWGSAHPFHHVPLTEKDTMTMDLRVHPDFRGRNVSTAFYSQSIQELGRRGCERVYATVLVNNVPANRMLEHVGFRPLVRWHAVRGGYAFEREMVR